MAVEPPDDDVVTIRRSELRQIAAQADRTRTFADCQDLAARLHELAGRAPHMPDRGA